jgi:hypothetical protein
MSKGVNVPTAGVVDSKDTLTLAYQSKCHRACLFVVERIDKTARCDADA